MAAQGGVLLELDSFIRPPFLGLMSVFLINNLIIPRVSDKNFGQLNFTRLEVADPPPFVTVIVAEVNPEGTGKVIRFLSTTVKP